ncbi:MAG: hypothetical protein AAGD14_02080 [Planctomycetota bacterium]
MTRTAVLVLLPLFIGCAGTSSEDGGQPLPQTRVVMQQHYRNGSRFVLENLAGRDIVELRSQPVRKGESPVAWVSDAEMRRLLKSFEKSDFAAYAKPRPSDPRAFGVIGEVTIYDEQGRARSILRRRGQPVAEAEAYQSVAASYQQVWTANRPKFQAATGDGEFGVKKAEFGR